MLGAREDIQIIIIQSATVGYCGQNEVLSSHTSTSPEVNVLHAVSRNRGRDLR